MKAYAVIGSSRPYYDYREWIVCDEETANQHCKLAQEAYDGIKDSTIIIQTPYD